MSDRREAIADDLRVLADDFKSLLESATTSPKQRRRKELRWRALYGGLSIATTLAARKIATKAWTTLTGEPPPTAQPPRPAAPPAPAAPPTEQLHEHQPEQAVKS